MLAFYPDDLSSNPTEVYNFSVKLYLKSTKINKKRPGLAHSFKKLMFLLYIITTAYCIDRIQLLVSSTKELHI